MLVANIGFESAAMKLSDLVCWTWPQNVKKFRPTSLTTVGSDLEGRVRNREPLIVSCLLSTKSRHVYSCLKKHPEHWGSFKLLKDLTVKQETIQEVGIYM